LWSDIHINEWPGGAKYNSKVDLIGGSIILQEIDEDILGILLDSGIPILDCTGKYNFSGISQL
jgi:hypothetical protein